MTNFIMTEQEVKAQIEGRKEIKADYELFTKLPYEVQNLILTEMCDNLEWLKGWTYTYNEIMALIKNDNPFTVTRGNFGIHNDKIMIVWGSYYNGMFSPTVISSEWLEQANL